MSVLRYQAFVVVVACATAASANAQIHQLKELSTERIAALDRSRTVVVMPAGIMEEHGPYLPSFSDGYFNEALAQRLAEAIVARPGWSVVMFPTIPLGVGGANEIGRKHVFPGTYAVRSTTLRAVFMDLATELGEQGFRWVFIVHAHGAPNHNRMLDQAGDYFRDTYGGHMVHLAGLLPVGADKEGGLSEKEKKEDGFAVHGGADETSAVLFLRPDLVGPVERAQPQSGYSWDDLIRLARAPGWPGYFGSPRLATAAIGAQTFASAVKMAIDYGLKILDGADERNFPRLGNLFSKSPPNIGIDKDAIARELEIEKKQQEWLRMHIAP